MPRIMKTRGMTTSTAGMGNAEGGIGVSEKRTVNRKKRNARRLKERTKSRHRKSCPCGKTISASCRGFRTCVGRMLCKADRTYARYTEQTVTDDGSIRTIRTGPWEPVESAHSRRPVRSAGLTGLRPQGILALYSSLRPHHRAGVASASCHPPGGSP